MVAQRGHFLGMKLQIGYLLALANDERGRAACGNYLKTWLPHFYPDRLDIAKEAQIAALLNSFHIGSLRSSWMF